MIILTLLKNLRTDKKKQNNPADKKHRIDIHFSYDGIDIFQSDQKKKRKSKADSMLKKKELISNGLGLLAVLFLLF